MFTKHVACSLLALAAPLAATAQQTVFYDTFGQSTLNQTNITGSTIPGGTASGVAPFTASSYTIGSAKDATATFISSGHLRLIQGATSSGNLDAQALFTSYPVILAATNDYIELTYTFTETPPILMSFNGTASALFLGLFNAHGSAPWSGGILQNTKYNTTSSDAVAGHAANWSGFNADVYNGNASSIHARPVQTSFANDYDQSLLYNYPTTAGSHSVTIPSPNLATNQPYTMQLRVTLTGAGAVTVSNALYSGTSTSGAMLFSNIWAATGANVTTNFDGLAIGYRANNTGYSSPWTNDVNNITVVASLAAQAGPYYFVTAGGNPCAGGVTIGLSGSVTTNTYLLLTNGVYNGVSMTGTGSAISFGSFLAPASYTVLASNTMTASTGLMYGSANVYAAGIAVNAQPSSVSAVTNLPASFSVSATGAALSYQWYKNAVALTNGGTLSGAQSAILNISAVQAGDAATAANGYTVVIQDPCGDIVTSAPPAALALTAPRNLIWSGANPDDVWDHSELNFSAGATAFAEGDDVTFDDSSANTSIAISNNVTPTIMTVAGTQTYTFSGPDKITGVAQVVDSSAGTLIIENANNYTGGTVVNNGATLQLGDGGSTANNGSLTGTVKINSGGNLNYNFAGSGNTTVTLNNVLAGSGTNNCTTQNGSTIATAATGVSSNFNGTINIWGYTSLHGANGNQGYAFGNGSVINIMQDGGQVWLDPSATVYNNTFNIQGNGWEGTSPYTGAIRIWSTTVTGPVNLLANSRIGGSIGGGTITGPISGGSYQLEVYGVGYGLGSGSSEFILSVSNSANSWGATLLSSGALRSLVAGSISTNSMFIDSLGELDTFGTTVNVVNLNDGPNGAGAVYNMSTAASGTLVVGGDGSSTTFDGTFGNGASQPLNLTKLGGGTLTLTAVSTNTGTILVTGGTLALSGSGSFAKASVIAPASGAVYDVTGAGGTMTLSSGQSLEGNGTVNGTLSAPAASIVQPGLPMGTLQVSSSATVSGIYRPNLNRTNANNCSTFTASGGVTFSGAILSVTNVGPLLQVGDVFQLFPGATAGFSAAVLQTNDVPNNANYVWNNTVATDGKITVASVVGRMPAIVTAPTAAAIIYGQALSNSVVSGGSCTNSAGVAVAGTFAFTTPTNRPDVGTANQSVTFTPTDTVNYGAITLSISVTVNPQTPVLKTAPTASAITNGNSLSVSVLTGGVVTNAYNTNVVAGTFTFTTPAVIPGVGTAAQSVTFTPSDVTHYSPITLSVNVTVVAPPVVTALKFTGSSVISGTNLTFSVTNTGAGTFYLLGGTNVASARNTWKPLWTNVAAGSSTFTATATNAVTPALGQQFYILSTTNNR